MGGEFELLRIIKASRKDKALAWQPRPWFVFADEVPAAGAGANGLHVEETFALEQIEQALNGFGDRELVRLQVKLGLIGRFVWVINARKALDFASARFLV